MLKKIFVYFFAVLVLTGCGVRRCCAQFLGYVGAQTVSTTPFNNTACTGAAQASVIPNLGQTSHYINYRNTSGTPTLLSVTLNGSWDGVNFIQLSDVLMAPGYLQATGYYPVVEVMVTCTVGTSFTVTYSGTGIAVANEVGGALFSKVSKGLVKNGSAGSTQQSLTFGTPYANTSGLLYFNYVSGGAGPSGSTLTVTCLGASTGNQIVFGPFNLQTTALLAQTIPVPSAPCNGMFVTYTSGGASAAVYNLDYVFNEPGAQSTTATAGAIGSTTSTGATIVEKGGRWSVTSTPAAGSQATASRAAGTGGIRHVADCVTVSAGASTAPVATILTINLRDGASGAGTILWQTTIVAAATAAQHGSVPLCGLNLIGSTTTAMTLEFSALLANEQQSVTLTGYDVQ